MQKPVYEVPKPMFVRSLSQGLAVLGIAACLVACGSNAPPRPPAPVDGGPADKVVHVVSNGWHTGLIVAREDVPPGRVPEAADMPGARYLEFGWGDREYYPSPQPTIGMALDAVMTPSPAVLHLAGRDAPPQESPPDIEVLAVPLTTTGLERLIARVDEAFDRPAGGRAASVAPGLYRDSRFYPAHGEFYLFNTCNTWIADKLAAGGVRLRAGVITADDLMQRLREALGIRGSPRAPSARARSR